jgi:GNAT superfamily N-acetyltransferase
MKIRKATPSDAIKISKLQRQTLDKINRKKDSRGMIEYLIKDYTPTKIKKKLKEKDFYVLLANKIMIGTISIEGNHIGRLFIRSSDIGRGYGKMLLKFAEKTILKKGYKKSELYPTRYAYKFYTKQGYKNKGWSLWKTEEFKVRMYRMEKKL